MIEKRRQAYLLGFCIVLFLVLLFFGLTILIKQSGDVLLSPEGEISFQSPTPPTNMFRYSVEIPIVINTSDYTEGYAFISLNNDVQTLITFDEETSKEDGKYTFLDHFSKKERIFEETDITQGKYGKGLNTENMSLEISIPEAESSLGLWFQIGALPGENESEIILTDKKGMRLEITPQGIFQFVKENITEEGTGILTPETWYHLILEQTNTRTVLFIDGEKEISSKEKLTRELLIGETHEGKIDEVIIIGRDLSKDEKLGLREIKENSFAHTFEGLSGREYEVQGFLSDSSHGLLETEKRKIALVIDTSSPEIRFAEPTPANGTIQEARETSITFVSQDEYEHSSFIDFNGSLAAWNGFETVTIDDETIDQSSYGINGILSGKYSQWENGKRGRAIHLEGNGSKISIPNSGQIDHINGFTTSLWVYPEQQTDSILVSEQIVGRSKWEVRADPNGSISCSVQTDTGFEELFMEKVLLMNQWNFISCTYARGELSQTVNALTEVISIEGVIQNSTGSIQAGINVSGYLDELMVWNRGLSQEETIGIREGASEVRTAAIFGLTDGIYTYTGITIDSAGNKNTTEARTINVGFTGIFLSSCTQLNTNDTRYRLTQNVRAEASCFTIGANNISLNCDGKSILYAEEYDGVGISSELVKATKVINCNLIQINPERENSYGVYYEGIDRGSIRNVTLQTSGRYSDGIIVLGGKELELYGNKITSEGASSDGIRIRDHTKANLTNNEILSKGNLGVGLRLQRLKESIVYRGLIETQGAASDGITIEGSKGTYILESEIITGRSGSESIRATGNIEGTLIETSKLLPFIGEFAFLFKEGSRGSVNISNSSLPLLGIRVDEDSDVSIKTYSHLTLSARTTNVSSAKRVVFEIANGGGENVFKGETDEIGLVPRQTLLTQVTSSKGEEKTGPHTINAVYNDETLTRTLFLNRSRNLFFIFGTGETGINTGEEFENQTTEEFTEGIGGSNQTAQGGDGVSNEASIGSESLDSLPEGAKFVNETRMDNETGQLGENERESVGGQIAEVEIGDGDETEIITIGEVTEIIVRNGERLLFKVGDQTYPATFNLNPIEGEVHMERGGIDYVMTEEANTLIRFGNTEVYSRVKGPVARETSLLMGLNSERLIEVLSSPPTEFLASESPPEGLQQISIGFIIILTGLIILYFYIRQRNRKLEAPYSEWEGM